MESNYHKAKLYTISTFEPLDLFFLNRIYSILGKFHRDKYSRLMFGYNPFSQIWQKIPHKETNLEFSAQELAGYLNMPIKELFKCLEYKFGLPIKMEDYHVYQPGSGKRGCYLTRIYLAWPNKTNKILREKFENLANESLKDYLSKLSNEDKDSDVELCIEFNAKCWEYGSKLKYFSIFAVITFLLFKDNRATAFACTALSYVLYHFIGMGIGCNFLGRIHSRVYWDPPSIQNVRNDATYLEPPNIARAFYDWEIAIINRGTDLLGSIISFSLGYYMGGPSLGIMCLCSSKLAWRLDVPVNIIGTVVFDKESTQSFLNLA